MAKTQSSGWRRRWPTAGRSADSLTYSAAFVVCAGRDDAEIARRAAAIGREVDELRSNSPLVGTPAEIADKLGAYHRGRRAAGLPAASRHVRPRPPGVLRHRGRSAVRLTEPVLMPRLLSLAVTGRTPTIRRRGIAAAPWYNRTPTVIGASVAGLAVIGILIAAVTFVAGQFNEPEQAPQNFVDPSFSATATQSSVDADHDRDDHQHQPPVTTDIDAPSSTTSSSSDTSSSSSETSTSTRITQSRQSNDGSAPSTTRRGPRTNVTRTLYPQP